MSPWEIQLEQRAAELQADVKREFALAQVVIAYRFSKLNRSNGQKRRYARQRQGEQA